MCSEKLDLMSQDYARQRKIRAAKNRAMKKWVLQAFLVYMYELAVWGKKAVMASDVLDVCHYEAWLCVRGVCCETGC